jgi:hypothetical protein
MEDPVGGFFPWNVELLLYIDDELGVEVSAPGARPGAQCPCLGTQLGRGDPSGCRCPLPRAPPGAAAPTTKVTPASSRVWRTGRVCVPPLIMPKRSRHRAWCLSRVTCGRLATPPASTSSVQPPKTWRSNSNRCARRVGAARLWAGGPVARGLPCRQCGKPTRGLIGGALGLCGLRAPARCAAPPPVVGPIRQRATTATPDGVFAVNGLTGLRTPGNCSGVAGGCRSTPCGGRRASAAVPPSQSRCRWRSLTPSAGPAWCPRCPPAAQTPPWWRSAFLPTLQFAGRRRHSRARWHRVGSYTLN